MSAPLRDFLSRPLHVFNVGLESFADTLSALDVPVSVCDWRPPAEGDADLAWKLARLTAHPAVEEANQTAFARYLAASPVLERVGVAGDDIPGLNGRMLLHSGPPIAWKDMSGPQRGALVGAVLFEGWADDADAAERLLDEGGVTLDACHQHHAVGPMAGVISPSMPVWVVKNADGGNRAYCNFNEGLGKVLRFGAYDDEVLSRLRWMRDVLGPVLADAVERLGGLELKPLMAQALLMGDEVHNRNAAATSLLFRKLVPAVLSGGKGGNPVEPGRARDALDFIAGNDHFFLNLSMAACKCMLDAAHGVPHSSLVTAMARNGVNFGIRVSGLGNRRIPVCGRSFFSGLRTGRRGPRPRRLGHHRKRRIGRFRHGGSPGHRPVCGRHRGRRPPQLAPHDSYHPRPQPRLHPAHAQFRPHGRRYRRAQGRGHLHFARHQYRHRP